MRVFEAFARCTAAACTAAAVAFLAACAASSAVRTVETDEPDPPLRASEDVTLFVLGNIQFLLLHEIAHFLISEKAFPIVGPEENAADYIATWALLREEPFDRTQQDRPLKFLVAAADAFAVSWRNALAVGGDLPYWGNHALSIQRYFQIVCLLYGSDPAVFAGLPQLSGLPESRARGCEAEYLRTDVAVRWLIDTYGRRDDEPPGAATQVRYEPPRTLVSARLVEELQSAALIERTLERLTQRFILDQPITVVLRACRQAEAAWMPDRRELVICYELVDYLYTLALSRGSGQLEPLLPRR
jgi:hypothetical protein